VLVLLVLLEITPESTHSIKSVSSSKQVSELLFYEKNMVETRGGKGRNRNKKDRNRGKKEIQKNPPAE